MSEGESTATDINQHTAKASENPIDRLGEEMNREEEDRKGVTDYIRNIFD